MRWLLVCIVAMVIAMPVTAAQKKRVSRHVAESSSTCPHGNVTHVKTITTVRRAR